MTEQNNFLSKEDYEEPCCPLKMNINQKAEPIPVGRVLSKVDEHLSRNDYDSAEKTLDYWHEEAKIGGDIRGELTILNEKIGLYRKTGTKDFTVPQVTAPLTNTKRHYPFTKKQPKFTKNI